MSERTPATSRVISRKHTPVQLASAVVGAAFLLVGILGFVPGVTTNYGMLALAGHHSGAALLGIFGVSVLHNVVHLAFGVIGLVAARRPAASYLFLLIGGIIYLVLWIYGLLIPTDSAANFVPVDTADNWLHLGLGVVMVVLGFALGTRRRAVPAA